MSASVSVSSSPGRRQHAAILIVVYLVVLLLPIILGAFQDLPRWSLIREFTDALLLVGFMALYIQFILSGRFKAMQEGINLSEYLVLSEPPPNWHGLRGILDEHTLDACLTDSGRKNWLYFVWGPDVMIKSVPRTLRGWGVPRHQIATERFTL